MAIKKEIDIIVNDDKAKKSADDLADSFKKVDKEADKAGNSIDSIADNGGAMAVLDSLTGGLATRLKDAYEASKLFNGSLKATRGALIATGIGAFIVALGLVVAYWDEIVEFIEGANKKLQRQIDIGLQKQGLLEYELEILELQQQTLEAQDLSTQNIGATIKETLQSQLLQAETNLELLRTQHEIELSKAGELSLWNKIQIAAGGALGTFQLINEEEKKRLDDLREGTEEQSKFIEALRLKIALLEKQERIEGETYRKRKELEGLEVNTVATYTEDRIVNGKFVKGGESELTEGFVDLAEDPEILLEQSKQDRLTEISELGERNRLRQSELIGEQELAQRDRIAQLKVDLEENTFALLRNVAKRGSDLSKAFAIADVIREQIKSVSAIVSNTGIANAKAVATSPLTGGQPFVTFNTIAGGLGIGASIAGAVSAIKDIDSERSTPSGGAGFPSFGASAPSFNLVEGTGTNQIASGLGNQSRPVQAYVVSGAVTTGQELDRSIQDDASLN